MLEAVFKHLSPVNVLVVGDFMVDHYTIGKIERISPEAPVPILHVERESYRPGGAGNVALNLKALGAHVTVLGVVGKDFSGDMMVDSLDKQGIETQKLLQEKSRQTIVKRRLIADSQHIMRIDHEQCIEISSKIEKKILKELKTGLDHIQVIAISDYNKGFLTRSLLRDIIEWGNARNIPILVDPKGEDFSKYCGSTLIKPNLKEAYLASKCHRDAPLSHVATTLIEQAELKHLVITRSEKGISLFSESGEQKDFPVIAQEVTDVTGAGDTVLAVLTFAMANKLSLMDGIELANLASGIAIGRLGCAHITLSEIASRLLQVQSDNKIFEENHLFSLIQALQGEEYTILVLDDSSPIGWNVLDHVRKTKTEYPQAKLILYLDDKQENMHLASLLSSFTEVDFVILKKEGLSHLLNTLSPRVVLFLHGDHLDTMNHVDQALERLTLVK